MITVDHTIKTSGTGYWSDSVRSVRIQGLDLGYCNEDETFAELRVYFDVKTWKIERDGLIYTDPEFMVGLRVMLHSLGLNAADVSYSEQGMQGKNYVSLDVGERFLTSYFKPLDDYHRWVKRTSIG